MSIPTHNLYDFVTQVTEKKFLIRYFYPWGSRELIDLITHNHHIKFCGISKENLVVNNINLLKNNIETYWEKFQPVLLCHDQEPLNFDLYCNNGDIFNRFKESDKTHIFLKSIISNAELVNEPLNLRWRDPTSFQHHWILLHSETNSSEVIKYEESNLFKCAYWWSHAIIARDWYRYAKYDSRLVLNTNPTNKLFLCYCRETTGSREYRKKVLSLLESNNLIDNCITSGTSASPSLSAEYTVEDFSSTNINIILETVADSRIHLTEKTLRPIACKQPFLLVAGPGSLKYLQSYGFKTFSPYINESYDDEVDQDKRIAAIIKEATRIASLSYKEKKDLLANCAENVLHNHNHFFSDSFFNFVISELKNNVFSAYNNSEHQYNFERWWKGRHLDKTHPLGVQKRIYAPLRRAQQIANRKK